MKRITTVLLLLILSIVLAACGSQSNNEDEMIAIVDNFQAARNESNWDLAASYLAKDIVWETPTGNVTGRDNWLATTGTVPGIFEDVKSRHVEGNTVIVEMIVTGPDFQSPATAEVVVEDGKIQRYTVIPPE